MKLRFLFSLLLPLVAITVSAEIVRDNTAAKTFDFSNSTASLPYDAQVEYIGVASGYPYINTGWTPNKPFHVEACLNITSTVENGFLMGARNVGYFGGKGIGLGTYKESYRVHTASIGSWAQNPSVYTRLPFALGEFHMVTFGCTGEEIYGQTDLGVVSVPISQDRGTSDWDKSSEPFSIFRYGTKLSNGAFMIGLFVANVKIYSEGELIMDLIPVRIADRGYMYDLISGNVFGNSGTGDFLLGPDL